MYKILIVDDSNESRKNTQAALIAVSDTNEWRENRLAVSKEHYKIDTFPIVGSAIDFVAAEAQNLPDLALLDISFLKLGDDLIMKANQKIEVEKTPTRGFAIYEKLKDKTQTMLFTAQANVDNEVANAIDDRKLRQGLDYITIVEKERGVNIFSREIKSNLEAVANQLIANVNQRDFTQFQDLINTENPNLNMLIHAEMRLDDRIFTLQNFFIYKFRLCAEGKKLTPEADFLEYIKGFFSGYLPNKEENEPIIEVLNPTQIPAQRRGWWKNDWVLRCMLDYRKTDAYQIKNQETDIIAANYILDFLKISHEVANFLINTEILQDSSIGQREFIFANNLGSEIFKNTLLARRVFLGLSMLAKEKIWSMNKRNEKRDILDFIMDNCNWASENPANVRNRFSVVLGLSIFEHNADNQRLRHTGDFLFQEESMFLNRFIPLILLKMQHKNQNQPAPDYTPFT